VKNRLPKDQAARGWQRQNGMVRNSFGNLCGPGAGIQTAKCAKIAKDNDGDYLGGAMLWRCDVTCAFVLVFAHGPAGNPIASFGCRVAARDDL
jgi:hypothetical protein